MSAMGELFVTDELIEMASKVNLLDLDIEYLLVPELYYDIWKEEEIPSEGSIDIVTEIGANDDDNIPYEEKKIGEIKYKIIHFVDDWGNGKFINYYVESLERDGVVKYFKKDEYQEFIDNR